MAMHLTLTNQVTMPDPPRDPPVITVKEVHSEYPPQLSAQQQPLLVDEKTMMEFPPVENLQHD